MLIQGRAFIAAVVASAAVITLAHADPVPPLPRPNPQLKNAAPPPRIIDSRVIAQSIPRPPGAIGKPAVPEKPDPAGLDPNQRALINRVNAYLSGINTLVGNFVQVGPDGSRTEGQFYLQKPGRVRFEYNPPSPIELIADGQSVVVRDRKLATQDLYPLSQTPLRFLLADRVDLSRDTNLIRISADEMFVSVTVEERQTLGGTHRLMLMFGAQDYQLRQWTVTDPQGYDTTVAVYNLDTTKKPDPAMFRINYERVLQ
jgi:outer membrane lipoprotein-sorting protein